MYVLVDMRFEKKKTLAGVFVYCGTNKQPGTIFFTKCETRHTNLCVGRMNTLIPQNDCFIYLKISSNIYE